MRDVLFLKPPKVAGTSIAEALRLKSLTSTVGLKEELEEENRWVTFGHLDYPRLVREGFVSAEFDESAYKFSWVRNPYDRAVSLWSKNWPGLAFDEFCRRIDSCIWDIGLANAFRNSLCNPQVRWLHGTPLNFLGRFESLVDDFERVCAELGVIGGKLGHHQRGEHAPYESYYTNETVDIIRKVYAEDFFWFGYET